jgi:glycosyltransferase involved in cell wall biosynthesis
VDIRGAAQVSASPPRLLFFGTYREEYARNQILIEGLRRAGWEVVECHASLWRGVEDRVQAASGGWANWGFFRRLFDAYAQLIRLYRKSGEYDVILVGYPGHLDVYLARFLASIRGRPLAWDVLNSLYLISVERGIEERSAFTVGMIRRLEQFACRLPDRMFLDTQQFVNWFVDTHHLDPTRFRLVQIGADDRNFLPLDDPQPQDGQFRIIYYGSYIPNHGVEYIIEAARLLERGSPGNPVLVEMVGVGPERAKAQELAERYSLQNVCFIDWLERDALAERIARADVVLGAFGVTRQLLLTNNNKIYEGFAMRKPVISARTPALPEVLQHGEHLYLCERGDPTSLAQAVRALQADPALCRRLAENGYRVFHDHFDVTQIGKKIASHLDELVGR